MKSRELVELLENPKAVTPQMLDELSRLAEQYPYFSTLQFTLLKGLKRYDDPRFSSYLSYVAAHAPSVEWLYLYLSEESGGQLPLYASASVSEPIVEEPAAVSAPIIEEEALAVDDANEAHTIGEQAEAQEEAAVSEEEASIEEEVQADAGTTTLATEQAATSETIAPTDVKGKTPAEEVAAPKLDYERWPSDVSTPAAYRLDPVEAEVGEVAANEAEAPAGTEPAVGTSLNAQNPSAKAEVVSEVGDDEEVFELIDDEIITSTKADDPIFEILDQKLYTLDEPASSLEMQNNLIDQFLSTNPRIQPKGELPPVIEDISVNSLVDNGEIVTEMLAKIYLSQGLIAKAVDVYEKLILKFPEKRAYFVAELEKISELK